MSFVNCSNHPSSNWGEDQRKAAVVLSKDGQIVDVHFPEVKAASSESDINLLAERVTEEIIKYKPDVVMCQGEFTLAFAITNRLLQHGIKTVAACSERVSVEQVQPDGSTIRNTVFKFVQFREYVGK